MNTLQKCSGVILVLMLVSLFSMKAKSATAGVVQPACFTWLGDSEPADGFIALREKPDAKSTMIAKMVLDENTRYVEADGTCTPEIAIQQILTLPKDQLKRLRASQWCPVKYKSQRGWAKSNLMDEGVCPDKIDEASVKQKEIQFYVCSPLRDDPVLILARKQGASRDQFIGGFYTNSQASFNKHLDTLTSIEDMKMKDAKTLSFEKIELQFSKSQDLSEWKNEKMNVKLAIDKGDTSVLASRYRFLQDLLEKNKLGALEVGFLCRPGTDSRVAR